MRGGVDDGEDGDDDGRLRCVLLLLLFELAFSVLSGGVGRRGGGRIGNLGFYSCFFFSFCPVFFCFVLRPPPLYTTTTPRPIRFSLVFSDLLRFWFVHTYFYSRRLLAWAVSSVYLVTWRNWRGSGHRSILVVMVVGWSWERFQNYFYKKGTKKGDGGEGGGRRRRLLIITDYYGVD